MARPEGIPACHIVCVAGMVARHGVCKRIILGIGMLRWGVVRHRTRHGSSCSGGDGVAGVGCLALWLLISWQQCKALHEQRKTKTYVAHVWQVKHRAVNRPGSPVRVLHHIVIVVGLFQQVGAPHDKRQGGAVIGAHEK